MRVTFLAHDGFFIELDQVCLLFDWWKGVLPPLSDKPLLVFVSHRHEDHFNPAVFTLADRKADIQFLLGSDFRLTPHNLTKWQLSPETAAKCRRCGKHDTFTPLPGVTVEAGAVIEYAIIGEGCHVGKDCRIGGTPNSAADGKWDLAVLAPDCRLEDGREVAPGVMLDHHGKEVLK